MQARRILVVLSLVALGCGGDDGGDGGNSATATSFRFTTMTLQDPHAFAFGALDVNGTVNDEIEKGMTMDTTPMDGNLDLSVVVVFDSLDQAASSGTGALVFPECSAPADGTACSLPSGADVNTTTFTNMSSTCLDVVADTTTDYNPATPVVATAAPCFVSDPQAVDVLLGSLTVPLIEAQLAATYVGDPATELEGGLVRGYLTQAAADASIIPDDIAVVGGMPLSAILRVEDKDTGPDGEDGWWFYINFTAEKVDYTP